MDFIQEHFKNLRDSHKELYDAYEEYGKKVYEAGPLDDKMKALIKIAISSTAKQHYAIKSQIRKARRQGCSWEEIEHAILLIAPTVGFPTMMEAMISLREEMGEL
ncbi:MAG: carboxymuconolactone decarboxylase family protein [Andreesenia angusta]|nr:carboxymuconolactone decarboxylase family protein [Andreesenia angusta]